MSNLFERGGLQQDTGLLRERWDQDGSSYVSATSTFSSGAPHDITIRTVTSGRNFYVKQVIVEITTSNLTTLTVKDGSTTVFKTKIIDHWEYTFQVPIKFETSAVWYANWNGTITLIGWEE